MTAILNTVLALLAQIAPALGGSEIASVISALVNIIPVLVQEYNDLVPIVKDIISALSNNSETTADQLTQLQALDAQCDAAFDAAAAAAQAQDGKAPAS